MAEGRTKKSLRNIVISSLSSVLSLLLNYITRIIFVRFLDSSYLGINGLFSNVLSILSLADLGIVTSMMFSLYKPLSDNDTQKITQTVNFFKKIYNIIAIVVAVIGLAIMPLLKFIVNTSTPINNLYVYYVLFLTETVISYLFVYRTTLLNADQKNYILMVWNIVFQVVKFGARVLILVLTKNFILYIVVGIACGFLCNIVQNIVTYKKYPFLHQKQPALPKEDKLEIYKNVKATFLYKFCSTIQTNTDSILISIFVSTVAVGYYSNYLLVINGIITFVNIIFNSLKSSIGNYVVQVDDKEKIKKMFDAMELLNFWLISFCSIAFMCLFDDFTLLSYGSEYVLSTVALIAIVLNFYTSNIRQNIWSFRETTGIFVQTRYVTLVTAILNLGLSILFGYFFGLVGILLATTLARLIYAWWKEPMVIYKNVFNKPVSEYLIKYIVNILITACVGAITYFACYAIKLDNIFVGFIIKCVMVAIIPNVIYLVMFFKNKNFRLIISKIFGIFKKNN